MAGDCPLPNKSARLLLLLLRCRNEDVRESAAAAADETPMPPSLPGRDALNVETVFARPCFRINVPPKDVEICGCETCRCNE